MVLWGGVSGVVGRSEWCCRGGVSGVVGRREWCCGGGVSSVVEEE